MGLITCVLRLRGNFPLFRGIRRRRDLNRIEKKALVDSLSDVFAQTSMVVVTKNLGLTVADVTELRRKVRAVGACYRVVKNRLAVLALEGTRFNGIIPILKGPTALAWADDPVVVAKVIVDFAKTNDKIEILGGSLGTQVLDVSGVKALAELPSLDVLRAQFVGLVSTPATRVTTLAQAPAAQLARLFGAYAKTGDAA